MKTQNTLNLLCSVDRIPLDVSLHAENSGACFSLDDPDNDQSRQVLLSASDTLKLYVALKAFLQI